MTVSTSQRSPSTSSTHLIFVVLPLHCLYRCRRVICHLHRSYEELNLTAFLIMLYDLTEKIHRIQRIDAPAGTRRDKTRANRGLSTSRTVCIYISLALKRRFGRTCTRPEAMGKASGPCQRQFEGRRSWCCFSQFHIISMNSRHRQSHKTPYAFEFAY